MQKCRKISNFLAFRKLVRGFTISELLVAVGLLAAVLAASGIVFHYSMDAQRTAGATAEIMRTLRAITDQINIDFKGLKTDGYLILWSDDSNSALYFFSTGEFQSWHDPNRSNIARIYFGPSQNDSNNLALDMLLLTSGVSNIDYNDASFAACQVDIIRDLGEDPCLVVSSNRPRIDITYDSNDARRLLAQHVGSFKVEWTSDKSSWPDPNRIEWFGRNNPRGDPNFENTTPYLAYWTPSNQSSWPKALKFEFTLSDSKGIIKGGRRFEHIVYIGK